MPVGLTAANRRMPRLRRTVGETDGRTPYRYIYPAEYYVSSVNEIHI